MCSSRAAAEHTAWSAGSSRWHLCAAETGRIPGTATKETKKKKTREDGTPRSAVAGPRNSAQAHLVSGESGELQKLQYPRREEGERLRGKDEPVNLR